MNEVAVVIAAREYREADRLLKEHTAGRRTLVRYTKEWRAERTRLTEQVAQKRIALQRAAVA